LVFLYSLRFQEVGGFVAESQRSRLSHFGRVQVDNRTDSGATEHSLRPHLCQQAQILLYRYFEEGKFSKIVLGVSGEHAGFDDSEPTSKSGGKAVVVDSLKKRHNYKNLVLIGDGATDLEASPPADAFIGYGGNVIRPTVQAKAKWFVTDFNEIIDVLNQ
jgi:hydroxymethylpyrimidine pyrophosphatase-like HAD family hydrolase